MSVIHVSKAEANTQFRRTGNMWERDTLRVYTSDDTDATTFCTNAGITDATQKKAVQQLVYSLKQFGIWTKLRAIYPMVGGTATTHKYNLKDPQDTNGAYRLSFNGGWTHNSDGALSNGTNAYADTFVNLSTVFGANILTSFSMAVYSKTTTPSGSGWVIGAGNTSTGNPLFGIALSRTPGAGVVETNIYDNGNAGNLGRMVVRISDSKGLHVGTATSSTSRTLYYRGVRCAFDENTTLGTAPSTTMYLGAINPSAGSVFYQSIIFAFAAIGDGLTASDVANLNAAVTAYQTILGRAV